MANIINSSEVGVQIFHDFHPDSAETKESDYNVSIPDVRPDAGNMHEDIAENMDKMRAKIMKTRYKKSYHKVLRRICYFQYPTLLSLYEVQ